MKLTKKVQIGLAISIVVVITGITSIYFITLLTKPKSFETEVQDLMTEFNIPTLAAGIVNNESIVWSKGFGQQPNLDTVFMIGSITKSFTASAILQLVERGQVNLTVNISTYLPFNVKHPTYPNVAITPFMLLTHTSGLGTNLFWSLEYYLEDHMIDWINSNLDLGEDILKFDPRPNLGEFLNESLNPDGIYYDPVNWYYQPGIRYHYSNAGYQLLSYLIEEITNKTYMVYLKENIFDPLNMTNTGFEYEDFTGRNAIPYEWHNNSNLAYPFYNLNVTGAGNLRSTVGDMAKYIITFINQGNYNGVEILESQSVTLMQSIQVTLTGVSTEGFSYEGYGFGWNIYSDDIVGHGGATPGFSSSMIIKKSSEETFGLILFFNRGSALVYDENLITNFIPKVNNLFFNQAEKLV